MKLRKRLQKRIGRMKIKKNKMFLIMTSIWIIDFITTIIGLNIFNNMVEENPVPRWFFSFGLIGWIIFPFISIIFIYLMLSCYLWVNRKLLKKKYDRNYYCLLFIVGYILIESLVIISNIRQMILVS